jgi:hypothetical protein
MSMQGQIEIINVVGMDFVDSGRSLRLEIVESVPPHTTRFLVFKNTVE